MKDWLEVVRLASIRLIDEITVASTAASLLVLG